MAPDSDFGLIRQIIRDKTLDGLSHHPVIGLASLCSTRASWYRGCWYLRDGGGDEAVLGLTLFHLFRHCLIVAVGVYAVVKLIDFIWRLRGWGTESSKPKQLMYRYLELQLWRTRFRKFWKDFLEIAVLGAGLIWLLSVRL